MSPEAQPELDIDRLRAFALRMHYEGSAAFADGPAPWEQWSDSGTLGTWQRHSEPAHPPARTKQPARSAGQRLLGGATRLLVLMLLVGIGGVYLDSATRAPLVVSGVQPPPIGATMPPVTVADATPAIAVDSSTDHIAGELETLPAPAAGSGTGLPAGTADTMPVEAPVTLAAASNLPDISTAASAVTEQAPETITPELPAPAASTPPAVTAAAPASTDVPPVATRDSSSPAQVASRPAETGTADQVALLQPAPGASLTGTAPAAHARGVTDKPAAEGEWVVNLASYAHESMARKMLEKFKAKGVDAELVTISVNDKPMVRIRTIGYQNAAEARDWVALLEERLGLEGVWISRR